MGKTKRKGIWIPDYILEDEKLDAVNKIIFAEIISLSELEHGCYASDEHFAKLVGIKRTSALKRIKQLIVLGYVEKRTIKGRGKYLFLKEKICELPVQKRISTCSKEIENDVPTGSLTSSPVNTINSYTNSGILKQLPEQKSIEDPILISNVYTGCTIMTQGQAARLKIDALKQELIKASKSGEEIVSSAKYLNAGKLWQYVENQQEYNRVLPLWKELVYVQNALYGK